MARARQGCPCVSRYVGVEIGSKPPIGLAFGHKNLLHGPQILMIGARANRRETGR